MNSAQSHCETPRSLLDSIGKVYIIAYREPTSLLEEFLAKEGFSCQVLRQEASPEQADFSSSYRCLLNHRRAWYMASAHEKPTLILEADFVPVVNFGRLDVPFALDNDRAGISWLYSCAPQIYNVSAKGYAQGFAVSMVAYIITPQAAGCLLELAESIETTVGPYNYSSWDSEVDEFLRRKNFRNYIPLRNYGEHGGLPNPEHAQHGLSKIHRADVLQAPLAFLPFYASQSKYPTLSLIEARLQARCKGLARLLLGKFLRIPVVKKSTTPYRLIRFAIARQLSLTL